MPSYRLSAVRGSSIATRSKWRKLRSSLKQHPTRKFSNYPHGGGVRGLWSGLQGRDNSLHNTFCTKSGPPEPDEKATGTCTNEELFSLVTSYESVPASKAFFNTSTIGSASVGPIKCGGLHQLQSRRIETDARQRGSIQPEPTDMYIPIKAFFVSRSIDLKGLASEPFDEVICSRKELVLRWKDRPRDSPAITSKPGVPNVKCWTCERYMVVYNYGSVVFFNFGDDEEEDCLNVVRKYCKDQFQQPKKDDYGALIRPTLQAWSQGSHDKILLRKLDIDNIRIISSILGQSIALDYFAKMVDEMINVFTELNRGMEQTGTFTMTRKKLFQLVASANSTLADVIVRMGLLERSDAAWKNINYGRIFEFMRDEFELDERFESLYFKLNIIQHNVRLFLEVLQNRKSDILEWIIILLLVGEIGVGVYDILHDVGVI